MHLFPIETIITNTWKGGKPDRNPNHPYDFKNLYKIHQSMKENSSLFMNRICRKKKTKVKTSSLRYLKIIPRKLNKILLS
jgi:hypothetical protein